MRLTIARGRMDLLLVAFDGLLGVVIGAVNIGWRATESPLLEHKFAGLLTGTGFGALVLGLPMLLATLLLAPVLITYLRTEMRHLRRTYYLRSAFAGIVFGFLACAGVGFFFGVLLPFLPQAEITLSQRFAILVGAPGLLMAGFGLSSFLFIKQILVTGAAFGLLNGWLVRLRQRPIPTAEEVPPNPSLQRTPPG